MKSQFNSTFSSTFSKDSFLSSIQDAGAAQTLCLYSKDAKCAGGVEDLAFCSAGGLCIIEGLLAFIGEPVADAVVQKDGAVAQDEDEDDWPHMGFQQFPALLYQM